MKPVRVVLPLAGLALLAALLWLVLREEPLAVETAPVAGGPFTATVAEDGQTRVRHRHTVSAPVAGRVLRPSLRPGDAVAAGDVVAEMLPADPAPLDPRARREAEQRVAVAEALVAEAVARRERADAEAAQAQADAERARTLAARGVVAEQQAERAVLAALAAARDARAAALRLDAARHEAGQARIALWRGAEANGAPRERIEIRAPAAGRVLRVQQESEAVVAAGTPLMDIADPADLEVVVELLTTDAVALPPGAEASIEAWGGPRPLAARLRLAEPGGFTRVSALGVEEQRVRVVLDLLAPHEQRPTLGDGFRVTARIVTEHRPRALLVPVHALFRRGADWAVFVVANGRAEERRVELAARNDRVAVVQRGLAEGERVVLFPPAALADGRVVAHDPR
jgi:HlyD family secretion protein